MRPIDPAGFEAMFRNDVDPWNYATSPFEAFKRGLLLRACGERCRGRVLELACANGETSKALAPKSLRLLALDASATAVAEASRRTRFLHRVTVRTAVLPEELPRRLFDLVVVSELLYYLPPRSLTALLERIVASTAPGGRVVLLHHLRHFADASQPPALVHAKASAYFRPMFKAVRRDRRGRYEVLSFDRRL